MGQVKQTRISRLSGENVVRTVVKVVVSGGQARVTIPKDLAVKRKLLSENGEAGEATYVSATKGDGGRIVLHPLRLEELTEDE